MRVYLINLERRKDRLKAMQGQAAGLGLELERVTALDAGTADRDSVNRWFATSGPLGEIPAGDKACLLSHRAAWERFVASGEAHAVFLEDDVRLSRAAGPMLASDAWIPDGAQVVKLEHYGPPGQRVLLADIHAVGDTFRIGRMLSRHTGGAAYILSRQAAAMLLAEPRFDLPVDHLLFNPNNSELFARLKPWQLLPAIARQQEFVGEKSDIEKTRAGLRAFGWTYIRRELVRFGYDLKLLPRQIAARLSGAKFVNVKTAD
ncbi:MAG TPA: glycosyltransferase family 25 protein [Rhizomicrobium sp.]|jgi:glycosyl transferase family 25|nr:glycosyltransferase family 25 protein [Rhizomicrobium sp.]